MFTCQNCQFSNSDGTENCARCGHSLTDRDHTGGGGSAISPVPGVIQAMSLSNPTIEPTLSLPPRMPDCTPVPSHPNITLAGRASPPSSTAGRTLADPGSGPVWTSTPSTVHEVAFIPAVAPSTICTRPTPQAPTSLPQEPVSTRRADSALAAKSAHTPTPAPVVRVRLVVLRGLKIGIEYPIYDGRNTIGRFVDKPVDLDLIAQESVEQTWCSRNHAAVTLTGGTLSVEDLNSLNGTWVNGKRITPGQPRVLQANDVIQVGTVQLKVLVD